MKAVTKNVETLEVPEELVYEKLKGVPIYYRNYTKVLSGELTLEEVVGSSGLQGVLIAFLVGYLFSRIDRKKYLIATNEVGFRISSDTYYSLDVAVFDRKKLKTLSQTYVTVAPEVVIEVDTKANLENLSSPLEYFHVKTQDLLDAGVHKVIWIFTKERKVWVAEKGKKWVITDWKDTIEVLEDISINLEEIVGNLLT